MGPGFSNIEERVWQCALFLLVKAEDARLCSLLAARQRYTAKEITRLLVADKAGYLALFKERMALRPDHVLSPDATPDTALLAEFRFGVAASRQAPRPHAPPTLYVNRTSVRPRAPVKCAIVEGGNCASPSYP